MSQQGAEAPPGDGGRQHWRVKHGLIGALYPATLQQQAHLFVCLAHTKYRSRECMLRTIPIALHSPAEAAYDDELTQADYQAAKSETTRCSMGSPTQHESAAAA